MNFTPNVRTERHKAYKFFIPETIEAPVLWESPHDHPSLPNNFEAACDYLHLNRQVDYHIGDMFRPVLNMGMPLLCSNVHRGCVIDFNRALTSVCPEHVDGPLRKLRPNPNSKYAAKGLGLVRTHAYWGEDTRIRPTNPTEDEILSKVAAYWYPYHSKINDTTEEMIQKFGKRYHISCHSFPMEFMKEKEDIKTADIIIGTKHGTTSETAFTNEIAGFLRNSGLTVLVDECLAGAECVRQHGQPNLGRNSLQIEIVRELFMCNNTFKLHDGFKDIQSVMMSLAEHIKHFALEQSPLPKQDGAFDPTHLM